MITYWLMVFLLGSGIAIAFVSFVWWLSSKKSRPAAPREVKTTTYDDPELGSCMLVWLELNGERVLLDSSIEIEEKEVNLSCYFDESEGPEKAVNHLKAFLKFARDSEFLKICRNRALSQLRVHNEIFPDARLTESQFLDSLKLSSVTTLGGDQASFIFSTPKFFQGRPVYLTVNLSGEIEAVGVG